MITLFFDNYRIGQVLDPDSFSYMRFGGIQIQMAYLIKGLLETGKYRIVIFSDQPFSYPGVEVRPMLKLIKKGVPIVSRWINSYRKKRAFHADTPRRIFMHSHVSNLAIVDAALELGVETVFRINSDALVDGSSFISPKYLDVLDSYLPKHSIVVCQSAFQQQCLKEHRDIDSPIVTMGTAPVNLSKDKDFLLWVGRSVASKQPWLFLDIARRLPEYECRMILGTANVHDEGFADVLAILAADMPNLIIERNIEHADMASRYAQATAFISTSLLEGAPNVFAEAGMASAPVFSLAINPANMLDGNELGVCAEGDFERLLALIREYLEESSDEMAIRQNRAREFAQSRWSIENMIQSYRHVFEYEMTAGSCEKV